MSRSRIVKPLLIVPLLLILSSVMGYFSQGFVIDEDRFALTTDKDVFDNNTQKITYLDQNWSGRDSLWFYNTTQGSNWMPYPIFLHLEQANSHDLFRSDQNMDRYRYLVQAPSKTNPDGLPVGFVKNNYKEKDYIGFTCAACHTGQIDYKGVGIRIDGAPALADMDLMIRDLEQALKATLNDTAKFERLAKNVLTSNSADNDAKAEFKTVLEAVYAKKKLYNIQNNPVQPGSRIDYGFGRLDAFGRIFNRVSTHLTTDNPTINPPNAPVSYPFLWDTPHSDFVQWNGSGDNHGEGWNGLLGVLGRNTGEVLGVFADFEITKNGKGDLQYESSADRYNLQRLEQHLQSLQSPLWPNSILPPIDESLAEQGEKIYKDYKCDWCHSGDSNVLTSSPEFKRDDPDRLVITQFATLESIRTDPMMAANALQRTTLSGIYEGEITGSENLKIFPEKSPLIIALSKLTHDIIFTPERNKPIYERGFERVYLYLSELIHLKVPKTQRHNNFEIVDKTNPTMLKAYKARTLNGIWATAPYLHNGSVPTLYDLFLPHCAESTNNDNCRPNKFTVGSREFDPVKVGFISKKNIDYPQLFEFETSKPGNSNKGHEYAAGVTSLIKLDAKGQPILNENKEVETFNLPPMNHKQRVALVEYLKSL